MISDANQLFPVSIISENEELSFRECDIIMKNCFIHFLGQFLLPMSQHGFKINPKVPSFPLFHHSIIPSSKTL